MYLKFIILSVFGVGVIDVLFYFGIRPLLGKLYNKRKRTINTLYWGFSLFTLIMLGFAIYHYAFEIPPPKFGRIYLMGFIFIVLLSKAVALVFFLLDHIKNLVYYLLGKNKKMAESSADTHRMELYKIGTRISRGTFLRKTGVIAGMLPFISLNYGMLLGAFNFKIRKTSVHLPHIPDAFNGLKILQISDIHSGSFISGDPLKKAVELIMEQEADLILFTGDLVNEIAEEAEQFIEVFKEIKAPMGVYSILGNHDYGHYFYDEDDMESKLHNRRKMIEINQAMGWELLMNEHRILERDGESLALIGSENWGKSPRFPKYGDLDQATANMLSSPLKILMTHDPSHWEAQVLEHETHFDLTLSGHTHGFQMGIEMPGFRWSPAQYLYKQWGGLYEKQGKYIYVNRGLGFIGYPGRVGIRPEITVIELTNQA